MEGRWTPLIAVVLVLIVVLTSLSLCSSSRSCSHSPPCPRACPLHHRRVPFILVLIVMLPSPSLHSPPHALKLPPCTVTASLAFAASLVITIMLNQDTKKGGRPARSTLEGVAAMHLGCGDVEVAYLWYAACIYYWTAGSYEGAMRLTTITTMLLSSSLAIAITLFTLISRWARSSRLTVLPPLYLLSPSSPLRVFSLLLPSLCSSPPFLAGAVHEATVE